MQVVRFIGYGGIWLGLALAVACLMLVVYADADTILQVGHIPVTWSEVELWHFQTDSSGACTATTTTALYGSGCSYFYEAGDSPPDTTFTIAVTPLLAHRDPTTGEIVWVPHTEIVSYMEDTYPNLSTFVGTTACILASPAKFEVFGATHDGGASDGYLHFAVGLAGLW